jgi:hypothetical protein
MTTASEFLQTTLGFGHNPLERRTEQGSLAA